MKQSSVSIPDEGSPTPVSGGAPSGRRKTAQPAWAEQAAQIAVLAALFTAPALLCLHSASVADPDIWWHMRVGEWVLEHHAILRTDIFSRDLAGTPWLAYSWLFEVLVFKLHQWFGAIGIVGYSTAMLLAITVAISRMTRRLQADFTLAALLTFAACYSLHHLYTPRPWMFSILFFVIELDILLQARRTGRRGELAWLPLIFALWANIHIEYIYGLFAVGLAFAESVIARWRRPHDCSLPLSTSAAALVASLLATLVNPFGWRIYSVVFNLVSQGGGLRQVSEMQAIPFRDFIDYCLLALALASVSALAWSRRMRFFEGILLLFSIFMAFREQRDAWLLATVAVAVLAGAIPARKDLSTVKLPKFAPAVAAAVAAFLLLAAPRAIKLDQNKLDDLTEKMMPVKAVDAIRTKGYSGPIFNTFDWGGYLIWALREPVTIDGRTNLYGNERMDRAIATWTAQTNWASDPDLKSAGVVIGPAQSPLVQVLRMDSHYQLVYEDDMAVVFVHHA